MIDFANALALYDRAVGNGQPDELLEAADRLAELARSSILPDEEGRVVTALGLHLRTVATLNLPDASVIEGFLADIRALGAAPADPVVRTVHAIITFCSFYSSQDPTRLEEALILFAAGEATGIARLDTAAAINEIRTHSLALEANLPGHCADRVEELAAALRTVPLAPRLEAILAPTLAAFYGGLTSRYGDPRYLRQGLALLEPIVRGSETEAVADAALGGIWQLAALGLEYDAAFPVPRDMVVRAQCRVRAHRAAGRPPNLAICQMAHGLGLRARFDWERSGKRSGVLRALGYLRVAAQMRHLAVFYATTLRVAFEAGLGPHYLADSLAAFEAARADPGFEGSPPDDANYASTLMLIGNAERDPVRLAQAMDLYETAIARQRGSAVNVSRYINLAAAAKSYAQMRGGLRPFEEPEVRERLYRGLDAVIMMEVIDRPGSTHAVLHRSIASSFYALFRAQLGDAATDAWLLQRTIALFEGRESQWPIGLAEFLAQRIIDICRSDDVDCDLVMQGARRLEPAKLLLQIVDLCDGTGQLHREIDKLFAAAVEAVRAFVGAGRDAEGLIVVDRLTAGFVRQVTGNVACAVDERVAGLVRRAIAGSPLSEAEAGLVRRSAVADLLASEVPAAPLRIQDNVRLDLLFSEGRVLALRRAGHGHATRLFAARDGALTCSEVHLAEGLAEFALEGTGPIWVTFRNIPPEGSHALFNALRSAVEARSSERLVLRHGAPSLNAPTTPLGWNGAKGPPKFLIIHSPSNDAPALNFGFQFAQQVRALGAEVVELALGDCRREAIESQLPGIDALIVISHGHRSEGRLPDRILLSGADYLDADWLLGLGGGATGKTLFFVACNSGHFNARLTHDDIGFAPLALAMGARGVFATLRTVDELSILIFLLGALGRWRSGDGLSEAFEKTRKAMLGFDDAAWQAAHRGFIGGGMAARAAYRAPLSGGDRPAAADDRADIEIGWSFVLG